MSNFWAKFYEPLPSAPLKPNNASAIFGGQSPYGLRAAEPSIFRPKQPTPNKPTKTRKKVVRSHSDVGISKSTEKRKSREPVVKRKVSESRNSENGVGKNSRPVSPRKDTANNESEGDSPDGEGNGDRYPLFISVKKPSEGKSRKPNNVENQPNGISPRRASEAPSPKSSTAKSITFESQKVAKNSRSPFDSLRREKTDFIVRPRKSAGDTGSPTTALKREKSDITFKRSQSPSGVGREKSDFAKPRGSPASLRREKSDITLKRSQPPSNNFTREKSDLVRPRGSASPGPLRREKSDITAKRTQSPSGVTSAVKPRAAASPGQLRREKSDITAKRSQSPSGITREKSDLVKPRGSTSPGTPKREKSDVTKKPPRSPSKSNLPKPRVSASSVPGKPDRPDLKDSQSTSSTTSDQRTRSSKSPEPPKQNTKLQSASDIGKNKDELTQQSLVSETSESQKQSTCQFASDQNTKLEESCNPLRQDNSDIPVNNSSSEVSDNFENLQPQNCKSPEPFTAETSQRATSPETSKTQDCSLSSNQTTTTTVVESHPKINKCSDINNSSTADMSKIPTPTSTQVSRIPSLTKTSTPPSRIPPKSKIPSFSKTKSEEEPKKSHIPTGIPTSVQRADPAKENKDPALNTDSLDEVNKQNSKISRIPSAPKSNTPTVSKIPSPLTRQESHGDKVTEADVETHKSRIPSVSSSQPSGATPSVSKIPSFTKKHSINKTPSKDEPESKIPHLHTTTTPKASGIPKPEASGIPKPEVTATGIPKPDIKPATTESRIPHLHSPAPATTESRIPHLHSPAPKESGIPKPEVVASGIPKPETPTTPTESKIPQFSTPRSKIPAPAGSVLTRKDSEERIKKPKLEETPKDEEPQKVDEALKVEESSKATPSPAKVPPPPPPRQDVSQEESKANLDLSMNEDIFSEAKRMEELLRNESIVVEVPATENGGTTEESYKGEISKLVFEKAPDSKEMVDETVEVNDVKEKKKADQFSFKTFGKREDVVTVTNNTETVTTTTMSLGLKKDDEKTEEVKETISEATSPVENKETPAIDTLGQYEQQSRRSRSRQRKIISPDGDEANKTFDQVVSEDVDSKPLDTEPPSKSEDTETKAKSSKSKGKHDKPKFVIKSSIGADFYQSKSSQSKDSITEEDKPKEVVVIENKAFDDSKGIPKNDVKKTEQATNKDSAAFEDVEISSNKGSKMDMRAWSMEQLDEKTVKCSCGRGGKCSIM